MPVLDSLDYDARPTDVVRAGMVKSTKRHEMKQVILRKCSPSG